MNGRERKKRRRLPAMAAAAAAAAALAGGGPAFGDDTSYNTRELTVAECTTAWNGSSAANSCGDSVSANGQSLDPATIAVDTDRITIDYGTSEPPVVVGVVSRCVIAVECMPANVNAAQVLANDLAVSASFTGSVEDVADLVNRDGSLEVE